MALIPADASFAAIAKEATPGTFVAATNSLRATTLTPTINQAYLPDDSMQADAANVHDLIQGVNSVAYELDSYLYADEVNWWLASILGDATITGASDPYTTAWSLLNTFPFQPVTHSISDANGNNARGLTSMRCQSLAVKYTMDGLATVTGQLTGKAFGVQSAPTFSAGSTRALPGWGATVSVAGSTAVKVSDMEWDLTRTVTPEYTFNGTQSPDTIFAGGDFECKGSGTLIYDTVAGETILGDYLNGTVVAVSLDLVSGANREVKFNSTQCIIDTAALGRDSGSYAKLPFTFHGIANATDAGASGGKSPVKVTTKAPNASGTYA